MPPLTRSKRKHQEAELEKELVRCAWRGDLERMRELVLMERVLVNCRNGSGPTALHWAVVRGHVQAVRFLLENGAIVDASDKKHGNTPLVCAVFRGQIAIATLLLEYGADIEMIYHDPFKKQCPRSLLAIAITKTNVDMVALLLRFGAKTDNTRFNGKVYTALGLACRVRNSGAEIVQLLLDHEDGADVNSVTPRSGKRPATSLLCAACLMDNLEIARLLIQRGSRVVYSGLYPESPCPLKHAVANGSLELVRLLLDNSPFSAVASGNNNSPRLLGGVHRPHPLTMPLISALKKNKLDTAQLLVDRGANVNDGTFLCGCVRDKCYEGARFLLRNGANVNQATRQGNNTPLWTAAYHGDVVLLKEYLKAGADLDIRNKGGETPLGVAYRLKHTDVVYLLLRTSPHVWPSLEAVWQKV